MKKVLLIMPISTLNWGEKNAGGVDSVCQMLVRELASRTQPSKYRYRVLAFDPKSQEQYTGRPIILSEQVEVIFAPANESRIGLPLPGIVTGWLRVREQISNYKPDIVHAHMNSWMIWPGGRAKNILTLHSYRKIARKPVSFSNDLLYEKIIPSLSEYFVDIFTCVGSELVEALKKDTNKPIHIVSNPIDIAFNSQLKNEMVKTQDNKIKLVTCALISRRKRVDLILALLKEIRKSGRDVTLNIIGPNVDPVYYSELEMLIKEWELSDHVLFLGRLNQKEIIQQYQDADIGVFLSDQETFGLAPLEMLAAGLPLIATAVGILGERKDTFSKLGVTYYSNEQIENIACSIDSILYRDMRKAQDYIRSHFSAQGVLEQYESLYDEVIR